MNLSICDSGNFCVPIEPIGFWVAITINGSGRSYVSPSTVTLYSSIICNNADCVFGDVLFISSARSRLHIAAPCLNSNFPVCLLYIENPVISDGITSGVNCTLLHLSPNALANACAIVVFPTPGISSNRTCPPTIIAIYTLHMTSSFPITDFLTSLKTALDFFK